jgi:lysozyme family protein
MADFNKGIAGTLAHEGGDTVTDDKDDTGGLTKYGISQQSYPDVDIKGLTEAMAKTIYKRDYWDRVKADAIDNQAMANSIFDCAVNMGVSRAAKLAQEVAGASIDGKIGSQSLGKLNNIDPEIFDLKYRLAKIRFYAGLCNKKSSQKKFLLGWINRTLA